MKVRYSYLQQQFANPEAIFEGIRELLKTGDFTLGPQVAEFEGKFAKLIGTKYAIGVASGTTSRGPRPGGAPAHPPFTVPAGAVQGPPWSGEASGEVAAPP